jgi:hypothetical protein
MTATAAKRLTIILLATVLLFGSIGVGTGSALTWQIETVDSSGYSEYTSIVLSVSGESRISYYDQAQGDLRFAKNNYDGGGWKIETLESAGDIGLYTSLVLDSAGNPCISYYDYTNSALKYASKSGTGWSFQTVDSSGDVGLYTSLALNNAGQPCISYYDQTQRDLKYAVHTASGWTVQTVDSAGDVGQYSSLVLDSSGNPRISYFDGTNYRLKYAKYTGGAWQIQTVNEAGFAGLFTSLALDSIGNPRISCYDMANTDLIYAEYNGSAWQIQTIDSTGAVGKYSSLRLDGSDRAQISYYDETNQDLKYAALIGSAWQVETVESAGAVGEYNSLALDSTGNPFISYYDSSANALKVAHPPLPAPTVTSISPTVGVLGYTIEVANITGTNFHRGASVRLSRTGYPDIWASNVVVTSPTSITCRFIIGGAEPAYYRDIVVTNADGQSATIVNGFSIIRQGPGGLNWAIETVDSTGNTGFYPSIALDKYGRPCISYHDKSLGDLKYAAWDGTTWNIQTVDSAGWGGKDNSLQLDGDGNPHISYLEDLNGNLKYAAYNSSTSAWTIQTVDSVGELGGYTSLQLDSSGYPHISYNSGDIWGQVLKYAVYNGSAWSIQTVDSIGSSGATDMIYSSLALDSAGNPRISYGKVYCCWDYRLWYAAWVGPPWAYQTVDPGTWSGQWWSSSLQLDDLGSPRISYYDKINQDLKYAAYNGSAWDIQTVDSEGNVGVYSSLALDSAGNVHIAYLDEAGQDLKYARGTRIGTIPIPVTPAPNGTPSGGPMPSDTGTLYVASFPTGATILINGTEYGMTNHFVKNIPAGIQNITLSKAGYQIYTMAVSVPANDVKVLAPITLTKSKGPETPAGTGTLYIGSFPTNATILIDGVASGITNQFVYNIPAGNRNLTLTKSGYHPYTASVYVPEGGLKVLAPIILMKSGMAGDMFDLQ